MHCGLFLRQLNSLDSFLRQLKHCGLFLRRFKSKPLFFDQQKVFFLFSLEEANPFFLLIEFKLKLLGMFYRETKYVS